MNEIEYVFGTGDGLVHVWTSEADLELGDTGSADAVRLDFDGDGVTDDALWDATGSGRAGIAALDLDDDGVLDHFFTDPTGLGTWNHQITGLPGDAENEPLDWIVRTDAQAPDRLLGDLRLPDADSAVTQPGSAAAETPPECFTQWLSREDRKPGDQPLLS
ncbi:hypothetical protein ACRS6B_06855 [Nocardia asteroides]